MSLLPNSDEDFAVKADFVLSVALVAASLFSKPAGLSETHPADLDLRKVLLGFTITESLLVCRFLHILPIFLNDFLKDAFLNLTPVVFGEASLIFPTEKLRLRHDIDRAGGVKKLRSFRDLFLFNARCFCSWISRKRFSICNVHLLHG